MLVCQTLDFIFGTLGLVNKMPNLSSWDFILVTLGIPKPQTLDFISGNGLDSSRPSSLIAYTDPAQHPAKHLCQTSPPQSGEQPSSLHSTLHCTLHSTLAKLRHNSPPKTWPLRSKNPYSFQLSGEKQNSKSNGASFLEWGGVDICLWIRENTL